mmetsp:Transcript_33745/g.62977  ORF Transcript_33745/g.62977 Transcript_33745/m.62977 type:complete len:173 (+) Transcript_33745:76-594(+)
MQKLAIVLSLLACVSHGRRMQAAFNPSSPGTPVRADKRTPPASRPVDMMKSKLANQLASSALAGLLLAGSTGADAMPLDQVPIVRQQEIRSVDKVSNLLAAGDAPLTEAQKRFLADRQKVKEELDADYEAKFLTDKEEKGDKKNIYTTIVGGLIVVAFIAPMVQYYYYTGGD